MKSGDRIFVITKEGMKALRKGKIIKNHEGCYLRLDSVWTEGKTNGIEMYLLYESSCCN